MCSWHLRPTTSNFLSLFKKRWGRGLRECVSGRESTFIQKERKNKPAAGSKFFFFFFFFFVSQKTGEKSYNAWDGRNMNASDLVFVFKEEISLCTRRHQIRPQKKKNFHLWIVVNGGSYLLSHSSPLIHPSSHNILYTLHISFTINQNQGQPVLPPFDPPPIHQEFNFILFSLPIFVGFFPSNFFSPQTTGFLFFPSSTWYVVPRRKERWCVWNTPRRRLITNERSLSWQQEGSRMKEELHDGCYCDEWWLLQLGRGTWGQIWLGKGCENLFLCRSTIPTHFRHYHHTHTIELARFYSR